MTCECGECGGSGEIACPACDGTGWIEDGIGGLSLSPSHPHFEELEQLKRDAAKAAEAAAWLTTSKPANAESYARQLAWAVEQIEHQAAKLLKEAA